MTEVFAATDEQAALRDAVRKLAGSVDGEYEPGSDAARALWSRLGTEMGLVGLLAPVEYGGAGGDVGDLAPAMEELGAVLTPTPFFATAVLAVGLLRAVGDRDAMAAYLPGLCGGTTTATVAITGPEWDWFNPGGSVTGSGPGVDPGSSVAAVVGAPGPAGSDAGRSDPTATSNRTASATSSATSNATATHVLTGGASYVLDGTTADLLLVCATTAAGRGVFAVDADAPGLRRVALDTFDGTRPLATLDFEGTPARLVGAEDESDAISAMLDLATVCLALEQVGGARRCLDMAVGYARERVQFGRAIGSFQAIKHWCADLLLDYESARSAAYAAAWAADRGELVDAARADRDELVQPGEQRGQLVQPGQQRSQSVQPGEQRGQNVQPGQSGGSPDGAGSAVLPRALAALAGAFCSEAYVTIAAANIQIHGGMGFTWEHPAHRFLRRARSGAPLFGDPAALRERLVHQLERHDVDLRLRPARDPVRPSGAPGRERSNIAAGLLEAHGNEELKVKLLEPLRTGEATWCLLYSEPGAGSDLASVQTTAVPADDGYLVNGQKVWTSGAREADYGLLLARTDWDVPKHEGLSMFLLPMRQPGVEIRPLRQITGEAHFNEVFLTDAQVPATHLIGGRDDGWRTMATALAIERSAMGERNLGLITRKVGSTGRAVDPADLVELARRHGRLADPVARQAVARGVSLAAIQSWNESRAKVEGKTSRLPVLSKLAMSRLLHTTAQVRRDILGPAAMLDTPDEPDGYETNFLTLNAYFTSIGGGTDQIQRSIIGERALGLPREPAPDHGLPFRQVRKPGSPGAGPR